MLDFAQETGRAGRDQQRSKSILITSKPNPNQYLEIEDKAFLIWLENKIECRRYLLNEYLDGYGENCFSSNLNSFCDICYRDFDENDGMCCITNLK